MISDILIDVFSIILTAILSALTVYLITYIKYKTFEIKNKIKDENIVKQINIAETLIETSVAAVAQTFVDDLKKNGKFDRSAQSEAFEMSKQKILASLPESAKSALCELYGDMEKYIDCRIEYYVRKNKMKATGK